MLETRLVWNPRGCKNGNVRRRGVFEGTLYAVTVGGKDIGQSVAYQLGITSGDVFTVWWDGTIGNDSGKVYPYLYQYDTGERLLLNPDVVVWFDKLENIGV